MGVKSAKQLEEQFLTDLGKAVRSLRRRDPVIRDLIRRFDIPTFRPHNNYFVELVDSIVSQQISGKAAASILGKLEKAIGKGYPPRKLAAATDEELRSCGLSPQKLGYIRSLVEHVRTGQLELNRIAEMPDEEVTAELTAVKGIGVWTAQMFLIFSLGRLNVLPTGDLGVQKGVQIAYGLAELPKPKLMEEIAEQNKWAPYRSVASWYMWRALETV